VGLRVYNTLTRQKEKFKPRDGKKVGIYVCGVTPYNYCHVGNARPYVVWDVIRRYLEYKGYDVLYVQNFTDVDDKIMAKAAQEGRSPTEVANQFIAQYFADMDALGIKRAHVYPRVTEHIPEIIETVNALVAKGYAYEVDGDIYYDVSKFADYGKLSGRSLEDLKAGARVEVDERKNNPMDFALWKKAKPGEMAWDSPWGPGRPGWHIECSVMAHKYLGDSFDFHGGGVDLVFPHHENEIAQSEAYTGKQLARYWLHNGFVNFSGKKMAKSVGNVVSIAEARKQYPGIALRLYLLSTHYRSPIDFDLEKLGAAVKGWERLQNAAQALEDAFSSRQSEGCSLAELSPGQREFLQQGESALTKFIEAMDDDFNTALAVGVLFDLVREINIFLRQPLTSAQDVFVLSKVRDVFTTISDVLGLVAAPEAAQEQADLVAELMRLIINIRQAAREKKDFALADKIREQLAGLGFILEDTPHGVRYRRK
jgi:cysteinyl-tRNA synthetase